MHMVSKYINTFVDFLLQFFLDDCRKQPVYFENAVGSVNNKLKQ